MTRLGVSVTIWLLLVSASVLADDTVSAHVPTYVDDVQRGLRLRVDLGERYTSIGSPAPAVTLEVAEEHETPDDLDVTGMVIFSWDRPFGVPLKTDVMGDGAFDINREGANFRSPFLDNNSVLVRGQDRLVNALPRLRLYSAFVGVSFTEGDFGGILKPLEFNVGRQTQMVESPITYDGASVGWNAKYGQISTRFKLWGGFDALNHIVDDPFTRSDGGRFIEEYDADTLQTSNILVNKTYGVEPVFTLIGGTQLAVNAYGFGVELRHTSLAAPADDALPTQRSELKVSYNFDSDFMLAYMGGSLMATNFLPTSAKLSVDGFLHNGSTRFGTQVKVQILEDVVAYDSTFLAFDPEVAFDPARAAEIENARRHDNIRYLNFARPKPHILWTLDGERTLIGPFTVTGRLRLRQHFEEADVDFWRTNLYEGALGASYAAGMALNLGFEVSAGLVDSGKSAKKSDFDLVEEGVQSFVNGRLYTRTALLDAKLIWFNELFVRRQDLASRSLSGFGQWSGAFATTVRYDILDFWSVAARADADLLSPFDSTTTTGYFAAHAATSIQF